MPYLRRIARTDGVRILRRGLAVVVPLALYVALLFPVLADHTCTVSTTSVAFPPYLPGTATPLDINGAVSVTCTKPGGAGRCGGGKGKGKGKDKGQSGNCENHTYAISIDSGISNDSSDRYMELPALDQLHYNLYKDAARSQIWGDGIAPAPSPVSQTIDGAQNSNTVYPVYGRCDAFQDPTPGSYSDTVTVTVAF